MSKIGLIATYKELVVHAQEVARELGIELLIENAILDDAIPKAKKLKEQGCQAIISRGGTYKKLEKAQIGIPIVGIRFTGYDMIRTLQEDIGSVGKNIALVVSNDMVYDIEKIGSIFNIKVKEYRFSSEEDNLITLNRAISEGAELIISGASQVKSAEALGIPGFLIKSGKESIWFALNQAREVAEIRRKEQERANQLQAILDFAYQGIIGVDAKGKINIFNSDAEKALSLSAEEVIGCFGDQVIPEFAIEKILSNGQREVGCLVKKGIKQYAANKIPIIVKDEVIGGVITFQEVSQVQDMEQDIRKKLHLKGHIAKYRLNDVIGISRETTRCKEIALEFAKVNSSVLILGETGVGKEVFAQSIHNESTRASGPFVAVNCAVLPEYLLESELFGYAEGAFTGARKKGRAGYFELAHGGTLFLDEIGEIDLKIQARLLRVIEERQVIRLGDEKIIPVDVRIIAATNKDLSKMLGEGQFREDLYYRLNVLKLKIPRLSERKGDIELLVEFFLKKFNQKFNKNVTKVSDSAMELLLKYNWPGNIRQLENFIECLVVLKNTSAITVEDIQSVFLENTKDKPECATNKLVAVESKSVDIQSMEAEIIKQALQQSCYNYTKAAEILGINRTTLWRKIKRLGL